VEILAQEDVMSGNSMTSAFEKAGLQNSDLDPRPAQEALMKACFDKTNFSATVDEVEALVAEYRDYCEIRAEDNRLKKAMAEAEASLKRTDYYKEKSEQIRELMQGAKPCYQARLVVDKLKEEQRKALALGLEAETAARAAFNTEHNLDEVYAWLKENDHRFEVNEAGYRLKGRD
jgi:hypothetical protein